MVVRTQQGVTRAEGILEYPAWAEGFGRRRLDVHRVHWFVPTLASASGEPRTVIAKTGEWQFPAGVYEISIARDAGEPDERRVLLGDRRRRHREVDADSLAYEERRGSGERRKHPDAPGWH